MEFLKKSGNPEKGVPGPDNRHEEAWAVSVMLKFFIW